MEVFGYLYFKFIHIYKFNLEKSPPPPASSTSETQDEMSTVRFYLLSVPPLLLKASTPSTPTVWLFLSVASLYNILALDEDERVCKRTY